MPPVTVWKVSYQDFFLTVTLGTSATTGAGASATTSFFSITGVTSGSGFGWNKSVNLLISNNRNL